MQRNETFDFEKMIQQSLGAHAVFAKNSIVFCNRAFESITGYSRRELTLLAQKTLAVLFKDGDGDLLSRLIKLCQKGEQITYHPEIRLATKKGDPRWIEIALSPVEYEDKPAAHLSCIDKTENKKRYDTVSGMARAYWEMLNAAKILAVMFDTSGMVIFCNDSMLDAIGWSREEILGRNWFDTCVTDHGVKNRFLGAAAKQTVPRPAEYEVVRKDGGRRTFVMSSTIVRDSAEAVSGVMSLGEDRTELRRAELELREQQGKFAGIVDHAEDGIILTDEDGAVVAWNRGIERISGIFRNEALGRPLWEVQHRTVCDESKSPESFERAKLAIEEMLLGGETKGSRNAVETIQRFDGTRKKVRRAYFPVRTARGFRLGSVVRDVTEIIGFQEALQDLERNYRLLAESISGMLFLISRDKIMLYVNGNGAVFLAKPVEAIVGKKLRDLFPPHIVVSQESMLARVFEGGSEMTGELLMLDRWFAIRFVPSIDRPGIVSAVLMVADDITRRKHSERRLWDAKERAGATMMEKSECIADLADAVRTPLHGIAGLADALLTTTQLTDVQRDFASAVERSSVSLLHDIEDIFDLSDMETGKFALEFASFDLHEAVRDVVESLTPLAHAKRVGLSMRYAKKLPRSFIGDGGRIRRIVRNLVATILHFTGRGHVTIDVDGGEPQGNAGAICLRVRDTGSGISPQEQRVLFERSAPPDDVRGRARGRMSRSLSVGKQLVAMMNGSIGVESAEGGGSTFTVSLTLAAAPGKSGEPGRGPVAEPSRGAAPVGTRALVVEDDDIIGQVARALLGHCGCGVETSTAREAIDSCKSTRFDIVLIDCQTPDGYETARSIRRVKDWYLKSIVVAMTSNTAHGERKKMVEAGIDDVLVKPLTLLSVRALIRRHFAPLRGDGSGHCAAPGEKYRPAAFSMAKIRSITGSDPAAVRKLVELSLRTYPPMMQHLEESIATGNFDKAASIAQGITASAGAIGAFRLAETAAAVAIAAIENRADSCGKIFLQLRKENDKLLYALREMKE